MNVLRTSLAAGRSVGIGLKAPGPGGAVGRGPKLMTGSFSPEDGMAR